MMKLTDKEWRTLYTWIDYNAPDKGYFNANKIKDFPYQGFDQIERRTELTNKYGNGMGVDWKKEIADYATYLKGKGEVTPVLPGSCRSCKRKKCKSEKLAFRCQRNQSDAGKRKGNTQRVILASRSQTYLRSYSCRRVCYG